MFVSIRRGDSSEYEPSSLETMKNSIDRYLQEKGYTVSLRDRQFVKTTKALSDKKQDLKKKGLGRLKHACEAISPEDENKLVETGEISTETAESLQFGLFYFFGKYFALRGRDEHRYLKFGDVEKKTDGQGQTYLEYPERASKTMDGSGKSDYRLTVPRAYSVNSPTKDPVHFYDEFVKHRPDDAMDAESPMYLTPIPTSRLKKNQKAW